MEKEVIYIYSALLFMSPFLASLLCMNIGKKVEWYKISSNYQVYVVILAFVYFGAFFLGEHIIPILNIQLYNMNAKAMGAIGVLEDFLIPVIFAFPAFLTVNKLFRVTFFDNWKKNYTFLMYYSVNFVCFFFAIKPFTCPTY